MATKITTKFEKCRDYDSQELCKEHKTCEIEFLGPTMMCFPHFSVYDLIRASIDVKNASWQPLTEWLQQRSTFAGFKKDYIESLLRHQTVFYAAETSVNKVANYKQVITSVHVSGSTWPALLIVYSSITRTWFLLRLFETGSAAARTYSYRVIGHLKAAEDDIAMKDLVPALFPVLTTPL
jgi:hypothetical protein